MPFRVRKPLQPPPRSQCILLFCYMCPVNAVNFGLWIPLSSSCLAPRACKCVSMTRMQCSMVYTARWRKVGLWSCKVAIKCGSATSQESRSACFVVRGLRLSLVALELVSRCSRVDYTTQSDTHLLFKRNTGSTMWNCMRCIWSAKLALYQVLSS